MVVSPTDVLLRYLVLPDEELMEVDLRQCSVIIMSHLDRLASPYMPPTEAQKVKKRPVHLLRKRAFNVLRKRPVFIHEENTKCIHHSETNVERHMYRAELNLTTEL